MTEVSLAMHIKDINIVPFLTYAKRETYKLTIYDKPFTT